MQPAIRIFNSDEQTEWAAWNASQITAHKPRHVPPEQRVQYASSTSLRQFLQDCAAGRWEPIGRKKGRAKGTIDKEWNAIRRWERFTRPDDWPTERTWPGPSLAVIESVSTEFFVGVFDRMRTELKASTVQSTRSHLRVIINHARAVQAIQHVPAAPPVESSDHKTRIYTPDEVQRLFSVLTGPHHQLAVALWIALHVGPRSVDLFLLRKTDIIQDALGRRLIDFQSRKTHKLQAVPISDETWEWIRSLPCWHDESEKFLFPGLSSAKSDDPEKSYQARMRNALAKTLWAAAGITDAEKPWQIGRATCNERYESHRGGVGEFILGHKLQGVNARNYRQPTEAVHEAVRTLPPYTAVERQLRLF